MCRGPQRAGLHHEVAVAIDIDRIAALIAGRDRGADRGRVLVADAGGARAAVEMIGLIEVPQALRPRAHLTGRADERERVVLDQVVQFGEHARQRDRRCVPTVAGSRRCRSAGVWSSASAKRAARAPFCALRSLVTARLMASMRYGSEASASPAIGSVGL